GRAALPAIIDAHVPGPVGRQFRRRQPGRIADIAIVEPGEAPLDEKLRKARDQLLAGTQQRLAHAPDCEMEIKLDGEPDEALARLPARLARMLLAIEQVHARPEQPEGRGQQVETAAPALKEAQAEP